MAFYAHGKMKDDFIEDEQHENERLWNRNTILHMDLSQLERHIKETAPSLYDDALRVVQSDLQIFPLRHGKKIRSGEAMLPCLQSMMLYYKRLYKKDCRVWMYKSAITGRERSYGYDVPSLSSDQETETTSQKPVTAVTDTFAYLDRAPFKLVSTDDMHTKPISTPELSADSSKPEAGTMQYFLRRRRSGIRRLSSKRVTTIRRMSSKSDTVLNKPRDRTNALCPNVMSSNCINCQINEDDLTDALESYEHIVEYNPGNPHAAIKSYTSTELPGSMSGVDARIMAHNYTDMTHWISPSTTPSQLSLTNISESNSFACLNTNNHHGRNDMLETYAWLQEQQDLYVPGKSMSPSPPLPSSSSVCNQDNVAHIPTYTYSLVLETEITPTSSDRCTGSKQDELLL